MHAMPCHAITCYMCLCVLFKSRGIFYVARYLKPDKAENKPDRPVSLSFGTVVNLCAQLQFDKTKIDCGLSRFCIAQEDFEIISLLICVNFHIFFAKNNKYTNNNQN